MADVGLKELAANCKQLSSLDFAGCENVTDVGLKELAANCKQLTSLNLAVGLKLTRQVTRFFNRS